MHEKLYHSHTAVDVLSIIIYRETEILDSSFVYEVFGINQQLVISIL